VVVKASKQFKRSDWCTISHTTTYIIWCDFNISWRLKAWEFLINLKIYNLPTTYGKITFGEKALKCLHHGVIVVTQGLDICSQHDHLAFHLLDFHLSLMELLILLQKLGLVSWLLIFSALSLMLWKNELWNVYYKNFMGVINFLSSVPSTLVWYFRARRLEWGSDTDRLQLSSIFCFKKPASVSYLKRA